MNSYPAYRQRPYAPNNDAPNLMDMGGDGMAYDIGHEQSLDEMVSLNERINRRKSMPVYGGAHMTMDMDSPESRRMSIMSFGDGGGNLEDFKFNMQSSAGMDVMMPPAPMYPHTTNEMQNRRMLPSDLAISTQFSNHGSPYPNMQTPGSAYPSPMHTNNMSLDMDMANAFPNSMSMPLDMTDPTLAIMGPNMNVYPGTHFSTTMMESPVAQDFMPVVSQDSGAANRQAAEHYHDRSLSATPDARSGKPTRSVSQEQTSTRSSSQSQGEQQPTPESLQNQAQNVSVPRQDSTNRPSQSDGPSDSFNQMKFPWRTPPGGFPSVKDQKPHMNTQYKNAYSSTGFDMLAVLTRVAQRPKPQIDIGPVDLSCAFVVCDAQDADTPIVYCSENFERLTGYTKHMILGRNCRFLQSPDGEVKPGTKRRYVDDQAVAYLKKTVHENMEAQISLINYRRGGQPFMNLLTMIPIAREDNTEPQFIVGFQVDLVEQPSAMTDKNTDGSYRVNYHRGMAMPSYVFNDAQKPQADVGQTISKDEVSNVLSTYGTINDSDTARRLWDKVLLENTDDVVHVLSLKGLFLYLSPSSNKVLEYDPSELVGTALSSVCHPSDIVPVTRELKETTNGASVNVVFRIRRKKSGYMWFEGHGSLHTEQGKGRKCIILVGRERPVYTLSKAIIRESGGIGDNELWSKLSTSGMFLFVSSNVRQLLDKQPEDLVGTSMQLLMRQESKPNFSRILELARSGRKADLKHEMINKRGQVLQAFTTIYPGDATEGQKPTFVIAQTRLLKFSRNSQGQRPAMYTSKERTSGDSATSLNTLHSDQSSTRGAFLSRPSGSDTPRTNMSDSRYQTTEVQAVTFSGQNGLSIGHQDQSLASEDNIFDELKTTRSTSWQYELRQMEKRNRYLAEEVQNLLAAKKKRKRRKGAGLMQKDCANCHTRTTPEWRRGPSGNRDLCNSCGLRWAKQNGRMSPRSQHSASDKSRKSASPRHSQSLLSTAIPETGAQSTLAAEIASPQQANSDRHAAKVARMEASASQGYGGGIPEKIEEGVEPI